MDLEDQVAVARWAVALVERDIHTTLPDRPTIEVRVAGENEGDGILIGFSGGAGSGWQSGFEFGPSRAATLTEVADHLQDQVCDRWWDDPSLGMWPVCGEHDRGLHATVVGHAAVWQCSAGPHVIARIGRLGA